MPRCKICNNTSSFGSSHVPATAQSANGLISGLIGEFGQSNDLTQISSMGADKQTVSAALKHPSEFFDVCLHCGSSEIEWDDDDKLM
jgi:hypothetical protein